MKAAKTKTPLKRAKSKSAEPHGAKAKKAPWDKPAPEKARHTHLTRAQKDQARAAAKKAGRPYPNLVDNMRAAKRGG